MFQAVVDPVAGSLALSALVACIPLAAFFVMLVGVKAKAHVSALVALIVALVVAIFAFGMARLTSPPFPACRVPAMAHSPSYSSSSWPYGSTRLRLFPDALKT